MAGERAALALAFALFCAASTSAAQPACPTLTEQGAKQLRDEVRVLADGAEWREAIPKARCLVEAASALFGTTHVTTTHLKMQLANLLSRDGQDSEVLQLQEQIDSLIRPSRIRARDSAWPLIYEARAALDAQDLEAAASACLRAHAIVEANREQNTLVHAAVLNSCGRTAEASEQLAEAEELYRRSERVGRGLGAEGRDMLSTALNNLGVLLRYLDRRTEAQPILEEALALADQKNPERVTTMVTLAQLHSESGQHQKALQQHMKARALIEAHYPPDHPFLTASTDGIASAHWRAGNVAEALRWQQTGNAIGSEDLLAGLSLDRESSRLDYALRFNQQIYATLSLAFLNLKRNASAARAGLEIILARKGRVLDAFAQRMRLRACGPLPPMAHVTPDEVQRALPPRSVLLEFASYIPIEPKPSSSEYAGKPPHYALAALSADGKVVLKDLGPRAEIDELIANWLDRMARPSPDSTKVAELSRALYARLLAPVESMYRRAERVFVSTDAQLSRVPFAALLDPKGRYALDGQALTYLSSGRALVRTEVTSQPPTAPVVVGLPSYGEANPAIPCARWQDLPADESGAVSKVLQVEAITGVRASEAMIKSLRRPRVLHLSAHGFSSRACVDAGPDPRSREADALLRSGLALAGANERPSGSSEGILTAAEVANLDLQGTELVVMSACESGLGSVVDGEGVFGLRRTFEIAGARRQIMSLWSVPVGATTELMVMFHTLLNDGKEPAVALREAQQHLRDHPSGQFKEPFFWAAFIAAGDYRSLTTPKLTPAH